MVQAKDQTVINRQNLFKPDEIWSLVLAGNNFNVIKENPKVYAERSISETFWQEMKQWKNNQLTGEALKINPNSKKGFIKEAKLWVEEQKKKHPQLIEELTKRITNIGLPADLPTTVDDCFEFQKFATNCIGIHPENSYILADEEEQSLIYQDVYIPGEETKVNGPVFEGYEGEVEEYLSLIPKQAISAIKHAHNSFGAQFFDQKKNLEDLRSRSKPHLCLPTKAQYDEIQAKFE